VLVQKIAVDEEVLEEPVRIGAAVLSDRRDVECAPFHTRDDHALLHHAAMYAHSRPEHGEAAMGLIVDGMCTLRVLANFAQSERAVLSQPAVARQERCDLTEHRLRIRRRKGHCRNAELPRAATWRRAGADHGQTVACDRVIGRNRLGLRSDDEHDQEIQSVTRHRAFHLIEMPRECRRARLLT
jgi:hypothetical protein